jgi:hypothetical protein
MTAQQSQMKSVSYNLIAGISLLLGVVVGLAYVRSYFRVEILVPYKSDLREYQLESARGLLRFKRDSFLTNPELRHRPDPWGWRFFDLATNPNQAIAMENVHGIAGFDVESFRLYVTEPTSKVTNQKVAIDVAAFVLPDWFVLVLLMITPAVGIRRWQQFKRFRVVGSCTACGYDLRATPDHCPECGAAVKTCGADSPA